MSIFIGSNAGETITPDVVSPSVTVIGSPKKPSAASDIILAGNGNDIVAGGGGDDLVSLGGGNDTFIWRSGDGNDIVDGGSGADRLQFNGSAAAENITVSAGILGSAQVARDIGNVAMNLIGVERIEIAALDGQDRVTVNDLARTDVKEVAIDLAGANPNAGDGQADTVIVNGGQAGDQITVGIGATSVVISGLAATTTIDHTDAALDRLVINASGGDDVVSAGNGLSTRVQLTIDGGAGNDTITGSDGNDQLIGGDGNDTITGGRGNDTAQLGAGDDTFVWNPGDGSDIVEGNAGTDTLQFNGSNAAEDMALLASGSHALLTRNVAAITMDLHGVENVNIAALGGADNITIGDMTGSGVKQIHVDLGAFGGADDGAADVVSVGFTTGDDAINFNVQPGPAVINSLGGAQVFVDHQGVGDRFAIDGGAGNDSVTANGTGGDDVISLAFDGTGVAVFAEGGQAVSVTNVEQLLVKGGAGNDTIVGQNGIAALTHLTIDGGAGNDTITGGDGNDQLIGGDGNDAITGGRGNDVASMGAGDDTFVWNPGDGSDTVEGGAGLDTMVFNGANVNENIDISANGGRALFTRNVANIAMDLNGVEHIDFHALGGADNITVNDLSGTDVNQVNVDLAGTVGGTAGDNTVDTVQINGTNGSDVISLSMRADGALVVDGLASQVVIEHFDPTDEIRINGLGGDDVIDASALGSNGPHITLDGGDGADVLLGGAGDDTLTGGAGDDVLLGNAGFDTLDGGPGNNVLIQDSATAAPGASASAYCDVHPDHATGEQTTLDHTGVAAPHSGDFLL